MKRFLIFTLSLVLFVLMPTVSLAEETDTEKYKEYINNYDLSCFDDLSNETQDMLDELGLLDFDYENIINFSAKDFFSLFVNMIKGSAELPLQSAMIILILIIFSSFFQNFRSSLQNDEMSSLFSMVSALIVAIILAMKLKDTISIAASTISVCADFVYAFAPVFCIIVATSGNSVAAFSTNSLLLLLSQVLNFISSKVFIPLANCFLCIGICSGIRSELHLYSVLGVMKRYLTTAISVSAAAFVSVLSIKTAVASRADAIGLRSIRFAINSVVPVIGSAISEGLLSIQSYSSLIRSSVGVAGIIAVCLVFLPSIISVTMWRFFLSLSELVSDIFSDNSVSFVLRAFCDTLLIINVILILSMVTTIISIGILVAAKGSA